MQLRIKQRVFSWTDSYDVYDEKNNPRYFVTADFLTLGHHIRVYDKKTDRELGSIHQKLLTLLPRFDIVIDGQLQGSVSKEFSLFVPRYHVDFRGWHVEGDLFGWDYQVYYGDARVMSISKELLAWGDTYVLNYTNPAYEMPGLLLVLAIDAANCDK